MNKASLEINTDISTNNIYSWHCEFLSWVNVVFSETLFFFRMLELWITLIFKCSFQPCIMCCCLGYCLRFWCYDTTGLLKWVEVNSDKEPSDLSVMWYSWSECNVNNVIRPNLSLGLGIHMSFSIWQCDYSADCFCSNEPGVGMVRDFISICELILKGRSGEDGDKEGTRDGRQIVGRGKWEWAVGVGSGKELNSHRVRCLRSLFGCGVGSLAQDSPWWTLQEVCNIHKHSGRLKLARRRVFLPWKLESSTNQGVCSLHRQRANLNCLQHTTA